MIALFGLGNPGERYQCTPHNAGFLFADALAEQWSGEHSWTFARRYTADIIKTTLHNMDVLLAKPQTFMNESGKSVAAALNFFHLQPNDIVVIHDDVDLPLGEVRMQFDRGSAGHKGVESIFTALGTREFYRLRIGVMPASSTILDTQTFVTHPLNAEDLALLSVSVQSAAQSFADLLGVQSLAEIQNVVHTQKSSL